MKYAIGAVVIVIALSFLSRWTTHEVNRYSPKFVSNVRSLVRYATQWATTSQQDENPLLSLTHINYALSYAYVARKLVPSKEVERIVNVNLDELIFLLEEEQLIAIQKIHAQCPSLQPNGVFAANTGWLA